MLDSERLALAAHVHVVLRRKTGRVTDTEWLAANADYAREIVRFCRLRALQDELPELGEWADKLERAMALSPAQARAHMPADTPAPQRTESARQERYIGGIR